MHLTPKAPQAARPFLLHRLLTLFPDMRDDDRLAVRAFGYVFPSPVCLVTGIERGVETMVGYANDGFAGIEIGVVPPTRADAAGRESAEFRDRYRAEVLRPMVGMNVGSGYGSTDRPSDYAIGAEAAASPGRADWLAVDLSRYHSAGLRNDGLTRVCDEILARVVDVRERINGAAGGRIPVVMKIVDDLGPTQLDDLVAVAKRHGVDALAVGPTVVEAEAEDLIGRPVFVKSTKVLAEARARSDGAFRMIGLGGIDSAETALLKVRAGADLIQVHEAAYLRQPSLPRKIKRHLLRACGTGSVGAMVGLDEAVWLAAPWNLPPER